MKDSPNLDLLRAIAVLLVVADHIGIVADPSRMLLWTTLGTAGVSIFFVHTCLVLMMSMERNRAPVLSFYVRRVFRIYPLAVAMVLLTAVMVVVSGKSMDAGIFWSNVFLVQNLTGHPSAVGQMWSLPYEVQMYLVLPLLFVLVKWRGVRSVAALMAASVALILALALSGRGYSLLEFLPSFLAGVLAFALGKRARHSPVLLFTVAAGVIAAAYLGVAASRSALVGTVLFWILCLAIGVTIPYCREFTYPPLARAAALVAKYSYSIYLTHFLAMDAGFKLAADLPPLLQWTICFALMAAWARVGYRWIEEPGIAWGKRVSDRFQVQTNTCGRAVAAPPGPATPSASSEIGDGAVKSW